VTGVEVVYHGLCRACEDAAEAGVASHGGLPQGPEPVSTL
jgi:hypothetical protein